MTTTFIIDNLKWEGCAGSIQQSLSSFSDVKDVQVNLEQDCVTVEYEDTFPVEKITNRLASLAYPERGSTAGLGKSLAGAKSYVSCAIGKLNSEE